MGDQITREARIIAVADVIEAISSHRPYRSALGLGAAMNEIAAHKGVLYDGAVADAAMALCNEGALDWLKERANRQRGF